MKSNKKVVIEEAAHRFIAQIDFRSEPVNRKFKELALTTADHFLQLEERCAGAGLEQALSDTMQRAVAREVANRKPYEDPVNVGIARLLATRELLGVVGAIENFSEHRRDELCLALELQGWKPSA